MIAEIAATLAFSAIQNNDKIGVLFFSDRVEKFIPPQKGRRHILYIIRELLTFTPQSRRTDLGVGLEYLVRAISKRCIAFVLSDFIDRKDFSQSLRIASRKHDVVAVRVYDHRMAELPDVGLMRVGDAETGHELYLDTSSKRIRELQRHWWADEDQRLKELFRKLKVDFTAISTVEDYVVALRNILRQRA